MNEICDICKRKPDVEIKTSNGWKTFRCKEHLDIYDFVKEALS